MSPRDRVAKLDPRHWVLNYTELMELYDELDIITEVKRIRLGWLGHMEKMSDDRRTKKLYSNKPEGLRLVGTPRKGWL
jgi:hypothetical protein